MQMFHGSVYMFVWRDGNPLNRISMINLILFGGKTPGDYATGATTSRPRISRSRISSCNNRALDMYSSSGDGRSTCARPSRRKKEYPVVGVDLFLSLRLRGTHLNLFPYSVFCRWGRRFVSVRLFSLPFQCGLLQ